MPNWRIILRNNDGSVVSNVHHGFDIVHRYISSLQWSPDVTSGDKNSLNSKLIVGPVNKTHNQLSYQCISPTTRGLVISSVEIMTVVGKVNNDCSNMKIINNCLYVTDAPSVIINADEIYTTSITISLNTYSRPASMWRCIT